MRKIPFIISIVLFLGSVWLSANAGIFSSRLRLKYNLKTDRRIASMQSKILHDSEIVNRIMNKLLNLREVKQKDVFVDSLTNHKKGITMRVIGKPEKLKKYYWIAVGYDSDLRFETYYNFYVWPDNMLVKYLDPISGKALTMLEWRRTKKIYH